MRRKRMHGHRRSPFRIQSMDLSFPIGSLGDRVTKWKEKKNNTMKVFQEDQKKTRQSTKQEQTAKNDAYSIEGQEINNEEEQE